MPYFYPINPSNYPRTGHGALPSFCFKRQGFAIAGFGKPNPQTFRKAESLHLSQSYPLQSNIVFMYSYYITRRQENQSIMGKTNKKNPRGQENLYPCGDDAMENYFRP